MNIQISMLILLCITISTILWLIYYPGWRRKRIMARTFPEAWNEILRSKLNFLDRLSVSEQQQLRAMIMLFVADKRFHGCDGLVITDEIRITIAAEACLLLLNRKTAIYPRLRHILVYPSAFMRRQDSAGRDGIVNNTTLGLLGESWQYGKVILSWDDVEKGVANFHDGRNVVLHEFSHQLDSESGSANGAPLLSRNSYASWATILGREYRELQEDLAKQHKSVMDYYGASNPAEFFAVATETFFEKPHQMKNKHPALYQQLSTYYAVNPGLWV